MKEKLIEKIKNIAKFEGIPESDLIAEEIDYFVKEHESHGGYSIELEHNSKNELNSISLTCNAYSIVDRSKCSHNNEDTLAELSDSIIYMRRPCIELDLQKERREKYFSH